MKKCSHTYSYTNYPFEEVLKRLASLGYQAVEVSAISECGTFSRTLLSGTRARKIAEQAHSLGLEIACYDCELLVPSGWNIASPDPEVRKRTIAYINSAIRIAASLGATYLAVVGGRAPYGTNRDSAWSYAVEGFRKCCPEAEKEEVILSLEHLTLLEGNVVVTLPDLVGMVAEVDSNNFGTLLDTGHVNVTGESLTDYVFQLADKLKHLHLDDNDGHSDDHLVPGMGNMNFVPLFAALRKIGYQGAVSIEAGISFSTDPDSAAQKGISFLNQHF